MDKSQSAASKAADAPVPLLAIAFVGIATLLFEILLTRIFSVTMWYHFAFVTISMALFGIAASGVYVARTTRLQDRRQALRLMAFYAVFFALAIPLVFVLDLNVPFLPLDSGQPLLACALFLLKFLLLSLPFFYSGLIIAIGFTNAPGRVNRLYFADMVGAGLGCALAIPILLVLSGPSAIVAVSAFAFVAAAILFNRLVARRATALCVAASAAVVVFVGANEKFGMVQVHNIKSYDAQAGQEREREKTYERWHPVSRVAVHPQTVSGSSKFWFYSQQVPGGFPSVMEVTNDAGARTFIYPKMSPEETVNLFRYDASDLVYSLTESPSVLVIGVGGGKDVLAALSFGAARVTGVELNPLMIDVVQHEFAEFSGRPYDDPRVSMVVAEGRNFIASSPTRYDVIKMSVTDTWAASARGAYSLNENYLYTREAIRDYMEHLNPGGFLTITRWYPQESLRLAALLSQSLRAMGCQDPGARVLMARNRGEPGSTMTCIVKNGDLTAGERARFVSAAEQANHIVVHATGQAEVSDARLDEFHRKLVGGHGELLARLPVNLEPPTDDRPFFFDLTSREQVDELGLGPSFLVQHARAKDLLVMLLILSSAVAILFVIAPMLWGGDPLKGRVPVGMRCRVHLYFLALGLGYLLIEIPLIQRFILFLGHPAYAVTVVLFSMLAASGLGSLFAARLVRKGRLASPAALGIAVLVLGLMTRYLPDVLSSQIGLGIAARVALTVAIIFPVAFLLGIPFPTGLRAAHALGRPLVPWAWAVNGAASVAAPALAMLVSMVWGFSATLYLGTAVYAVATLLLLSFSHMLDPKRQALAQQANFEPLDGSGSSPVGQERGGRREPQPRQRALEWSR